MTPLEGQESWLLCSALGFISLTSLGLNITQMTLICKIKEPRHKRLYHLIASLTLANLLTASITIPAWFCILVFYQLGKPSESFQKIHEIFYYSFDAFYGAVCFLHIIATIGERLIAIGSPLIHTTAKHIYNLLTSLCCWLLSTILCSTITVIYYFLFPKILVVLIVLILFFLPFVVILILCALIWKKSNRCLVTRTQRKERRATLIVVAVFVCCSITCLPFQILHFANFFYPEFLLLRSIIIIPLRCLYYSSCLFTPLIYLLGISQFRGRLSWCAFKCCARNARSKNDLYTLDVQGMQGNFSTSRGRSCDLVRHANIYCNTPVIHSSMVSADQQVLQTASARDNVGEKNEDEGANFSLYSSHSSRTIRVDLSS